VKRELLSRLALEGAAALSTVLSVLTVAWPNWIERAFGVDPDAGDGSLEWLLTAVLLTVAVTLTTLAVRSVRTAPAQVPTTNIR